MDNSSYYLCKHKNDNAVVAAYNHGLDGLWKVMFNVKGKLISYLISDAEFREEYEILDERKAV